MDKEERRPEGEEVVLPSKEATDMVTGKLDSHIAEDRTVLERFSKARSKSVRFFYS